MALSLAACGVRVLLCLELNTFFFVLFFQGFHSMVMLICVIVIAIVIVGCGGGGGDGVSV